MSIDRQTAETSSRWRPKTPDRQLRAACPATRPPLQSACARTRDRSRRRDL